MTFELRCHPNFTTTSYLQSSQRFGSSSTVTVKTGGDRGTLNIILAAGIITEQQLHSFVDVSFPYSYPQPGTGRTQDTLYLIFLQSINLIVVSKAITLRQNGFFHKCV